VFRRSLVLVAAFAAAISLVSAASATVLAHIRVEGRTQTIFGATDPRVRATNALDALQVASRSGEFYVHVAATSFGPYVDEIGLYPASGSSGWTYKVNGVSPPVGADQYVLKPGDDVLWYWATFGNTGGPPTLVLQRRPDNCYRVLGQDDSGATRPALGAVLHVDGHPVSTHSAKACIGHHQGLVHATLQGDVRSNAVP
jgi:hypothetical protein